VPTVRTPPAAPQVARPKLATVRAASTPQLISGGDGSAASLADEVSE